MKVIVGILLLVALAYLATSPQFLKMRRSTIVGVLVSGGWMGVIAGLAIGPGGLGILSADLVINTSPLLTVGLGWIGLMVGLQLRRDILKQLPPALLKLTTVDAAGSVLVFGGIAFLSLPLWFEHVSAVTMLPAVALLAAAAIGWTAETRTLRLSSDPTSPQTLLLRGAASLASPIAILIFSIGVSMVQGFDAPTAEISPLAPLFRMTALILIAIVLGILARFGLRRAEGNRSEFLAIFLGVVAIITGAASELDMSPLVSAMLAGIVIANLAGRELRRFERFILEAEHAVATLYWIVAGVLIDLRIGVIAAGIAVAMVAARVIVKPLLVTAGTKADTRGDAVSLFRLTPIRQSPMALMLGVALVIAVPSDLNHRLLTVIAMVGILSDVVALMWRGAYVRQSSKSEPQAAPEPSA